MKVKNIINKPRKLVLVMAVCSALPLVSTSILAEKSNYQEEIQAAGYIGKLSKQAIASGMRERLSAKRTFDGMERDSGHAYADLRTRIEFWHKVALDTVALDHTPSEDEGASVNQGGPTRTSRALAMIQIAVFEAVNAIDQEYQNYTTPGRAIRNSPDTSLDAAVAQAAYSTMLELYPDQESRLTAIFEEDLEIIRPSAERDATTARGTNLGRLTANDILGNRDDDRSNDAEPNFGEGGAVANNERVNFFGNPINGGTSDIGEWRPDPNTPEFAGDFNLSLGAYWGRVSPFIMGSGDQFRSAPPPLPGVRAYRLAYNEAAALGGAPDNINTPSTSTDETRFIGNFWGYDGVPLIGVPPRIYSQIASQAASNRIQDPVEYARYLAMVSVGMADAAIAAWDSKFYYNIWRPITGIREDDEARRTRQDTDWNPVGVSVVNTDEAIRPTPPFPAYPSGHAAFGATVFNILADFFGDRTSFTFVSDEFNGQGVDPFFPDRPRPLVPVRYESFSEAQIENGRSRVFNGVHWNFDDTAGQEMGEKIADLLLNDTRAFQPRR